MADDHGYSAIKLPQGLKDLVNKMADQQEKDRAEGKPPTPPRGYLTQIRKRDAE